MQKSIEVGTFAVMFGEKKFKSSYIALLNQNRNLSLLLFELFLETAVLNSNIVLGNVEENVLGNDSAIQ